ncbi:MAG TPA: LLM class flavin-dependent oxidoreductase, partial [Chloroflexota bacterium]|nr:LLM class flavin-dependent oxidoreductase [Chloroflexota bacterium]
DFSTRYHSVWVDVPSDLFDPVKCNRMYHEFLDELEEADRLGFDGICVNEHHQNAYGLMPSPNIMAATLTRRTSRAAIVVMGNSLALYNPPIRVAEEFAMLDVMSGGRLVAGFPVGTSMDTNYCYGQTPSTLREKYLEAHDLILQAWTRPEPFAFNGKYTQLRYVNLWPRPLQQPHPPIWVPGGGSLETWEWVARNNYVYSYLSYSGYKRGKRMMDGYWNALDQLGYDRNPYRAGFAQVVVVADSDSQAERDYAEHATYFYDKCLHVYEGFAEAPGYRSLRSVEAGLRAAPGIPTGSPGQPASWRELVDGGAIVAGSPATVRDQLKEVIETLRVGHLMLLMQFGDMPHDKALRSSELFAREVMPALKGTWGDWTDHWYPSGAGQAVL